MKPMLAWIYCPHVVFYSVCGLAHCPQKHHGRRVQRQSNCPTPSTRQSKEPPCLKPRPRPAGKWCLQPKSFPPEKQSQLRCEATSYISFAA